jgi:hypothetical protein
VSLRAPLAARQGGDAQLASNYQVPTAFLPSNSHVPTTSTTSVSTTDIAKFQACAFKMEPKPHSSEPNPPESYPITTIGNVYSASSSLVQGNINYSPAGPSPARGTMDTEEAYLLAQALAPFIATNFWVQQSEELTQWPTGRDKLKASIGSGSGQEQSRFSISPEEFVKSCVKAEFSAPFLSKLIGRCSMFEHHFTFDGAVNETGKSTTAKALELGLSNYENDAFTVLLRYDMKLRSIHAIIFLKLRDALRGERETTAIESFIGYLEQHASTLQKDPMLITNCVLSFYQHHLSVDYAKWRYDLYDMESKLGVTTRAVVFEKAGYEGVSFDYDTLNARLAWLSARAADTALSASTVLDQAKALFRLAGLLDDNQKHSTEKISLRLEEVQSTITRAELYLRNSAMVDATLTSMRAVLYNRITKRDSDSMKTIAVVTLFFLPATFVSAIFSTGVFDFFANEEEHSRTVSRWAWVYLLTCLLLTGISLVLWLIWYRWGGLWLEKIHLERAHINNDKSDERHETAVSGAAVAVQNAKSKDLETGIDTPTASGKDTSKKPKSVMVREIEKLITDARESISSISRA